ncbi:hypothetical protein L218DRAFT_956394 [Marasmius fiardii PR-910]|nr:hypothetical protein L218DRAFT_956394 [Marasmius fiardii PR-910]
MEQLSEEHAKLLLSKEWLAKTGTENSTSRPYLFKFCSSTDDLSCLVLITDTESVWVEGLNSNQFARRWRECNSLSFEFASSEREEEEWRKNTLKTLTAAHTVGGMTDFSFEVVKSRYSDFAFTLESDSFKWRWETCFVGHKLGSEIISRHLVLPLISVNHLAFASVDAVGEIMEAELEQGIDKVGRSARRGIDTHIKNAISKPRLASTLRRMTALFNFVTDLPSVISAAETPDLVPPLPPGSNSSRKQSKAHAPSPKGSPSPPPPTQAERRSPSSAPHPLKSPKSALGPKRTSRLDRWTPSPEPPQRPKSPKVASPKASTQPTEADSATESDDEGDAAPITSGKGKASEAGTVVKNDDSPPSARSISPVPGQSKQSSKGDPQKSPSRSVSPQLPGKKRKAVASSSSDDNGEETNRRANVKSGTNRGVKRGTRQPIKRGGKRF